MGGETTVARRACGHDSDLTSWRLGNDSIAFGHLGFEFWQWSEFSPRFLADFAETLGGHRLALVWGKV